MNNVVRLFDYTRKVVIAKAKRLTRKERKARLRPVIQTLQKELPELCLFIYANRDGLVMMDHTPMTAVELNALLGKVIKK